MQCVELLVTRGSFTVSKQREYNNANNFGAGAGCMIKGQPEAALPLLTVCVADAQVAGN